MMYIRGSGTTNAKEKLQLWKSVLLCGVLFILIALRGVNSFFVYVLAILSAILFLTTKEEESIVYLVFLAPFSIVLKVSVGGLTFFNLFILLVLIRMLFSAKAIDKKFIVLLLVFLAYCAVFSGMSKITVMITLGAWLLIVYCLNGKATNGELVVWSYGSGLCLSGVLGLLRARLPLINSFLKIEQLKIAEATYAERFSGLQPNPNYFGLDLLMAMSCIVVLMLTRKAKVLDWFLLLSLLIFGLMTVSQSFLVGLVILLALWMFFSIRQKSGYAIKVIVSIFVILVFLFLFGREYIDLFLVRLSQKQDTSLSSITTGRTDLWLEYFREMMAEPTIILFGKGLNTVVSSGHGAHNTYIELIFTLGLLGSSFYIYLIYLSIKKSFAVKALKIPIVILIVRLFAITMATWDNIWIYFIMFLCIANSNLAIEDKQDIDSRLPFVSKYII